MQVEKLTIAELKLDPNNARKHNEKNLDAIKGSLIKFGQQKPIVVNDKNIVVAGNGTLEAAKALGWLTIDAVRSGLDPTNQKAFALADNRSAELALWDDDLLGRQLHDLFADGFDIGSIGFESLNKDDPWGEPDGDTDGASEDGVINRVVMLYGPVEYQLVLNMAESAMDDLEIRDMSDLFKKLLENHVENNDKTK